MKKAIGWIGTGVMGRSMCGHILGQHDTVYVYNRTRAKAEELEGRGARWCGNPKELAEKSDYIFVIVGFPKDVEDVFLGVEGVLQGARTGSVIIDMTTSEPQLAEKIYDQAKARGVSSIDAPVSGGDIGARDGKLAIMAGGDRTAFDEIMPLFELLGENIAYMGGPGAGQHTKMSNQILIASTMIGVVESLLYACKAGLDADEVIDVIGKGAAASWSINNLGRRIAAGDFDPGFFIKHFVKDMGIALAEARGMNLSLPGLAMVHQFYVSAMALGLENLGTQGIYQVFARMNRMQA